MQSKMVETEVNIESTTIHRTTTTTGRCSRINFRYFSTLPGILKIVQLFFGIICMSCATPALISECRFFLFVVVLGFIGTVLWSLAYLLGLREVLNVSFNSIIWELIKTGIITLLYFISSIVLLANWSQYLYIGFWKEKYIVAGVFGLFNFLAYGAGTYFLFCLHRSGSTL